VEGFLKKSPQAAKQFLTNVNKFESAPVGQETSRGICMTSNELKRGKVGGSGDKINYGIQCLLNGSASALN